MSNMARKRKTSFPEPWPLHSKAVKRDEMLSESQGSNEALHELDKRRFAVSTPIKGKGMEDGKAPKTQSPNLKQRPGVPGQVSHWEGCELSSSHSPSWSEAEEEDTELHLVITLDGEGGSDDGQGMRRETDAQQLSNSSPQETNLEVLCTLPSDDESESSEDEFGQLDIDLERKSKQHNLTSGNIRAILHEVITHEHVVAMMKTAIKETQDMPMFEPKMTRSRLKQVVENGESIPTWNLSPIKRSSAKPPQFVDIHLEEDDSSDEEYRPDEDEEDETGEETFLSDVDSIGSSPRVGRGAQARTPTQHPAPSTECKDDGIHTSRQKPRCSRHLRVEPVPMGPPPPPSSFSCGPQRVPTAATDSCFLDRLHAVEEELAFTPICQTCQPLNGEGDGAAHAGSLVACRTRSKRPLRNVPLGQLEAELRAPDITPDMYDHAPGLLEEDRHWSQWLKGLMASEMDNEEDGEDDDDPEYNFLEDLDEPDLEDYRTDRAVRITKKEVNELLEELFHTFQDELGVSELEEEEDHEGEEEVPQQNLPKFNVPQAIRFDAPLASMLTERRRAVREQYEALQQRRALQDTPGHTPDASTSTSTHGSGSEHAAATLVLMQGQLCPALVLNRAQKLQLQQQVQQHVQLLTQVHLLSRRVEALHHEACITKQYLEEMQQFARREEESSVPREPCFTSCFRACNLCGALDLIQEVQEKEKSTTTRETRAAANPWFPRISTTMSSCGYPLLPAETAWLLATRPVFLYPELLPHCSLDPALHPPRSRNMYTSGEDCLIVLGLKHFQDTVLPDHLMCTYLIRKRHRLLRKRVVEMCGSNAPPDNVIKVFCQCRVVPPMPVACRRVLPGDGCPPVERETSVMPNWLKKSQPIIHKAMMTHSQQHRKVLHEKLPLDGKPSLPQYPPSLPKNCILRLHPSLSNSKKVRQTVAPKPFALAHTASLPLLAKAPADTVNCLARLAGPIPSQGVILIAKNPSTLVQGALQVGQAPVAPAHGTVPLAATYPVCVHPAAKYVSGNTTSSPTSGLVHTPPSILIASPLTTTCAMQKVTKQPDKPRKHLPRRPTQLKPIGPVPQYTQSRTAPPPKVTDANSRALARQHTLARPLLPALPSLEWTPFPSPLTSQSNTSLILERPLCDWAQPNTPNPTTNTSSNPKSSDYVLVQMAVNGSTQILWMSKNCLASSGTVSQNVVQNKSTSLPIVLQKQAPPYKPVLCPSPSINVQSGSKDHQHSQSRQLPLDYIQPSLEEQLHRLVEGLREEEGEEIDGWENVQGPLLTLSESSGSPYPPDDLERMKEEEEEVAGEEGEGKIDGGQEEEDTEDRREEWMLDCMEGGGKVKTEGGRESFASALTPSRPNSSPEAESGDKEKESDEEEGNGTIQGIVAMSGVTCEGGGHSDGEDGEGREGGENGGGGGGEGREGKEEDQGGGGKENGQDGGGEDREKDEGGQSGGEKDDDRDGEQDRQGEEEEEEDFDDLTQDEDEEVMSSASEESILSVPELQETMKKLTWLASEGRLCGDGDSEEDHSPNSPTSPTSPNSPASQNSQDENSEEEEEGPAKGEGSEARDGRTSKVTGDEDVPSEEGTPRASGKGAGRGRGRARPPPRSLRRSRRQDRDSKDSSKLLLLYDDHILDNDPLRESKDVAFAQAYLNRVREALQDIPGKMEEFLGLLYEFEQVGEGRDVVQLFKQLRSVLSNRLDLLRDFAAFLHPEQALECGLFEEQQAFERSRRFLRQLEISFGENPSHYQKIIKALQGGLNLSPASIDELKTQMATLLRGHTHLQGEFWVFFDELRPPLARPGQFEEAHWPEEGGGADGGEGVGSGAGGGASCGFEEVTLPDLEEEEEGHKIQPMSSRNRRRKIGSHGSYRECDWSDKDCSCLCHETNHDAKLRKHKRKGCARCHCNKASDDVSRAIKSLDPMYNLAASPTADQHAEPGMEEREEKEEDKEDEREEEKEVDSKVKDEVDSRANSPQPGQGVASWEGKDEEDEDEMEDEEEDEEWKDGDSEQHSPLPKKGRGDGERSVDPPSSSGSGAVDSTILPQQARPSPPFEPPVCAKNISLTASGEKVILWTREADRVILTTCQQEGANQSTFQAISAQLGNKTPSEVSRRFRDLMRLFRTAARQASSEDEAAPTEPQANTDEEQE